MLISDFFSSVQPFSGIFKMSRSEIARKKNKREYGNKLYRIF